MRPALLSGDTLTDCLLHYVRACPNSAVTFPVSGDRLTGADLEESSRRTASALMTRGVGPGRLVAMLVRTDARFLSVFFGIQRAGAACTVLPVPAGFADGGGTARRVARVIRAAGIGHLVLDDSYAELGRLIREMIPELDIVDARVAESGSARALPSVDPHALSIVQFTSGSTTQPKGVELTQAAVAAGLMGPVVSAGFSPDDVYMQWVPTFHDMGLVGLLSHLLNGADVHVFTPAYFLRHPVALLRYFAEHRGTVLTGPNFSYDYLLDALTPELVASLDLSSWRLAFNGAEPVRADTTERFTAQLAPAGVGEAVMYPVYGMAEATLAITFPALHSPVRVLSVDRDALAKDGRAVLVPAGHRSAKETVSCGRPVHGIDLRLVGTDGVQCGPGELGEIQIAGPALTTGYHRDPGATAAVFDGRWLRTGDVGFRHDGHLYITGRIKEMVIVRGQNFFPDDIEAIARRVPGVYRGRCVAFSDTDPDGTEVIRLVAEVRPRSTGADVAAEITAQVEQELDFPNVRVALVEPRWITRTTSGKWQRALTRQRIAEQHASSSPEPRTSAR